MATLGASVAILGFPATGHSAPLEWNLRVPVAAHFGPPFTGFESGLRADLLALHLFSRSSFGVGVGPLLEVRTLGISELGLGGGIEGIIKDENAALALDGGVSSWLTSSTSNVLAIHGSAALQLRVGKNNGRGLSWTATSGVYVRVARAVSSSAQEVTVGLELGGAFFIWAMVAMFGNHD
jgi:hypothetical protein